MTIAAALVTRRRPCVKPAEVAHELNISHVSELGIVLQGTLDVLAFRWADADVLNLAILKKLAVMSVLELNDLVHVLGRWCCLVLFLLLLPVSRIWAPSQTRLQLGLLSLLVTLSIVVRNFEDFLETLWWLHYALIT